MVKDSGSRVKNPVNIVDFTRPIMLEITLDTDLNIFFLP